MAEDDSAGGVPGRMAPDDIPGHTTRHRAYRRPWPFRLPQLPGARWRTRFLYGYTLTVWGDRYRIRPSYAGWTATHAGDGRPVYAATFLELSSALQDDWITRQVRQERLGMLMAALERTERAAEADQTTVDFGGPRGMVRRYVPGDSR